MILQALCKYYDSKVGRGEIAPDGFVEKKIDFIIHLDGNGFFDGISDLRERDGKKLFGKSFNVPAIGKQAQRHANAGNDANLLWDKSDFVMGVGKNGENKLQSFIDTLEKFYPSMPEDVKILLGFLKNENIRRDAFEKILNNPEYSETFEKQSPLMTFKIGNGKVIVDEEHVARAMERQAEDGDPRGVCLVTGECDVPISRMHFVIKGVADRQKAGCNLVSFNAASFCSHGMKQSLNAPTSKLAVGKYSKALQALIDSDANRVRISDATVVSWAQFAEKPEVEEFEKGLWGAFADPPKEDPDKGVRQVKALVESVESGKYTEASGDFYVLGLSPNAARLSVRYWETGPVKMFAERIKRHFDDFSIDHRDDKPEYLSLTQILRSTALENKITNVPPNIAGEFVRSVLTGYSYPVTLFNMAIRRNRAERQVSRGRAAILKAYLNRQQRIKDSEGVSEIKMGLDKTNVDIGYRLGRLFAVLEKIQEEALGNLNAGICDRFYGAASTTPLTVFPRLLRLKTHHMDKLDKGLSILREKTIGEIMEGIDGFPPHLPMEGQGRFAIGYYHQRRDFFVKSTDRKEEA
jgi:CRISPR-associated protein Csd1